MTIGSDTEEPDELDLTPSPRLLEVLGDIPYKPWQCFAELVDNSFDEFLSDPDRDIGTSPTVWITVPKPSTPDSDALVCVKDNGRGMSASALEKALRAGFSKNSRYGSLGLFGMGFNIATARLGNLTEVRTTRSGDNFWLVVDIDFREMQKQETYKRPLRREPKDDVLDHGTEVTVRRLRPELRDTIRRANTLRAVRDQLGRVYSYLLRSENPIPEVPDGSLAGVGFALYVNNQRVRPRLPCVWAGSRVVNYKGGEVRAIQPIEHKLSPALACMNCGHWHRLDVDACVECGSEDLQMRERAIRGWLGIQRYLDESDFGIDFLRHGRKILVSDKSMFTWENPDTGESLMEYPIELPANQGRIVGEIHLDHVPVNYQKNDFERTSRDWLETVYLLRGEGPLRSKKAKERGYGENESPLGMLFKGYQSNDPGLKFLVPGNGKTATHDRAREWGENFHKGLAEYLTDDLWYTAAADHDREKAAASSTGGAAGSGASPTDLGGRTGLDPLPGGSTGSGGAGPQATPSIPAPAPTPVETEEQRFTRYKDASRPLLDLDGEVHVTPIGKRRVRVFETTQRLVDSDGNTVPSLSRAGTGSNVEIYVYGDHEVFREYGRDPRDYAITEMVQVFQALTSGGNRRITAVAAEVTRQFPDQRVTNSALRDRAEGLLDRIRTLMIPIIEPQAGKYWSLLPQESKARAERDASRVDPMVDWRTASSDGGYASYLDAAAIATLVRADPAAFLDGNAFVTTWATWTDPEAKSRQIAHLVRLLDTLGEFLADTGRKSRLELTWTRTSLDMLDHTVMRQV